MTRKAAPMKRLTTAPSTLGVSLPGAHPAPPPRSTAASLSASSPATACGTRLMSAPHERQNFASSRFCAAHFGQYM